MKMKQMFKPWIMLDSNGENGGGNGNGNGNDDDKTTTEEATFEEWLSSQTEEVQTKYAAHVKGLKSALDKERASGKEVKRLRKQVKAFEDAKTKKERDEMSALEQAQLDLATALAKEEVLTQELRTERIEHQIKMEAMQMSFHDVDDAINLVDVSKLDLDGKKLVSSVKKQLKKVAEDKPYLIKTDSKGDRIGTTHNKTKKEKSSEKKETPIKTGIRF